MRKMGTDPRSRPNGSWKPEKGGATPQGVFSHIQYKSTQKQIMHLYPFMESYKVVFLTDILHRLPNVNFKYVFSWTWNFALNYFKSMMMLEVAIFEKGPVYQKWIMLAIYLDHLTLNVKEDTYPFLSYLQFSRYPVMST